MLRFATAAILLAGLLASSLPGQDAPSFTKDIKPFLQKYCIECHKGPKGKGEFDVTSHASAKKGGISFPGFIPGDPKESFMLILVEGRSKPEMPPKKSPQPTAAEKKKLRDWIAAGARDDTPAQGATRTLPEIKPRAQPPAPVTALAWSADGKQLVAAAHKEVFLIDPAGNILVGPFRGYEGPITALAIHPDGKNFAVASGIAGQKGQLNLLQPARELAGHADLVYGLAFSPGGKLLASAGYDRLIKLWDVATGQEVRTLKDHSDTIYGLAFSPDGKLLASAAADRAVKVWDVASGKRLYTLAEPTDWLYALAWSPDGKQLAAAGVDRSIRVWAVDAAVGRLVHSVFAHEGPVIRLAYTADGKTLYSLGEDRVVKAWETGKMVERKVFDRQPGTALALAVRPDGKQVAVGRFDGKLLLLDEAGKVLAEALPERPRPPQMNRLIPNHGRSYRLGGQYVVIEGKNLNGAEGLNVNFPGVRAEASMRKLEPSGGRTSIEIYVRFPEHTPAGVYQIGIRTAGGEAHLPFFLDLFDLANEQEPNDSAATGQPIKLSASLAGKLDRAGDVDFFRFDAQAGQEVGVQVIAANQAKLAPVLEVIGPTGNVLAESTSGTLGFVCGRAGRHAIGVRDRDYRGGGLAYRLHAGDVPVVNAVFPLGLQRGTEAEIQVEGVHLGTKAVTVKAPANAAVGSRIPIKLDTPNGPALGNPSVVVGEFPEVREGDIPVPGTANGRIGQPGHVDAIRFNARKGQRLIVEVQARRIGSPLDSTIEITDQDGKPVPRAVLRSVALTYTTFRDHDSQSPGIRIESWNELAINDYIWVGQQLLRIKALPKNPDDDCQFFAVAGQRQGFLGTTPHHLSQGTPMYKVQLHPPGSTFPPNGFPVAPLNNRNDDGGPGHGKDSLLFFDPPADGTFQVKVGDARGLGGLAYGYRLTVRPPRPDFQVKFTPIAPAVWLGGAVPISLTADRLDGYDGPIELKLENLPPGLSAPATSIPAGETATAFALFAEPDAPPIDKAANLKLIARAAIDGKEVVREASGGQPKFVPTGELVATTNLSEIIVKPGAIVRLTVKIERRLGFKGRVPVEVRGLPHGVRVLDIGLNGILITEQETARTMRIYCEPWVEPIEHPIVVLARREGKNTEHAARSVLLKVAGK